jgi:HSP20 family molecular chaperone IbpA
LDENTIRNSECYWGRFVRNIILPENLDFEMIKAVMENNLLKVTFPKLHISSQNIKINRI